MPQTHRITILILLLSLGFGSSPAQAADDPKEGLVVPAGRWLFEISVRMPMQSKPTVQRLQSCVTDDPVTAETLMPWAEERGCKVRSVRVVENKMTWKLRCSQNGQKSRGKGEFEVDGDQGQGNASVSFEMGGRSLTIFTDFTAKRSGTCTAASTGDPTQEDTVEDSE
jgi:hypothetical protein